MRTEQCATIDFLRLSIKNSTKSHYDRNWYAFLCVNINLIVQKELNFLLESDKMHDKLKLENDMRHVMNTRQRASTRREGDVHATTGGS